MLKNTREDWRKISGNEMSMIFQDSGNMINPIRRIGEQFTDYILAHAPQKSKVEAAEMAKDMLNKVRLPNPQNIMNSYPFELSAACASAWHCHGHDIQPQAAFGRRAYQCA